MREILDVVEIDQLNKCFADIFYELQRSGVLKDYALFDGQYLLPPPKYLLATDGTGYFSSSNIHCPYILGAKPGVHTHLFDSVTEADNNGNLHRVTTKHLDKKGTWTKKDRRAKRGGPMKCRSTQATPTCWSTSLSIPNSIAKQQ